MPKKDNVCGIFFISYTPGPGRHAITTDDPHSKRHMVYIRGVTVPGDLDDGLDEAEYYAQKGEHFMNSHYLLDPDAKPAKIPESKQLSPKTRKAASKKKAAKKK